MREPRAPRVQVFSHGFGKHGERVHHANRADRAFVHSLMQPVTEPGKMAAWIAPPDRGINNLAVDYEYVRLA